MFLVTVLAVSCSEAPEFNGSIQPWPENPKYWAMGGEPVLLLGGSKDDSLFQIPDLAEHLDLLASVGGNYIRNTMSDREDHDYEVHAFGKREDGKYDLETWNDEYWRRFESMVRLTAERGIVVQIEVWDRFDHAREHWPRDPFRPSNNVNYTSEETGFAEEYARHPARDDQPFFHTIPGMERYEPRFDKVRRYQERFVEKILSYTLDYGHVLYCMDNETSTPPRWGQYWMKFIRDRAAARGLEVYATDMFDDVWKAEESAKLRLAFETPEMYPFVDISQVNSRNFGQGHWDRVMWLHEQVRDRPRPLNNVKIYGDGDTSWGSGLPKDGVERFWRHLLAGSASVRFHRDGAGTGLQPVSQASIRAARGVESLVKFWDIEPHMELLGEREPNEAYLAANPGEAYVLYFTDGGSVSLNLGAVEGEIPLSWVDVATGDRRAGKARAGGGVVMIEAPEAGGWVAVLASISTNRP
ncbi:MAG: hypothetical protein GY767_15445 [Shimia sp.]|nr:hypothetical protein [Shimia sp.]